MKNDKKEALTLSKMTKSNVWDVQENDVVRMLESGAKEADMLDNLHRYIDIIRSAFMVEELPKVDDLTKKKYNKLGYKIGSIKIDDEHSRHWAFKKRPIMRITDLTYENIRHISAAKLVEVLDRNFGGGWDSLSQSIKDIIESGFDISTSTLPKDRLHKSGGMYEKKVNDGYDVLEIPKGAWIEAIFAKEKPEMERPRVTVESEDETNPDDYNKNVEDEDDINEENYSTHFDIEKDPDDEAESIGEEESEE
jgi:hypothetical protein